LHGGLTFGFRVYLGAEHDRDAGQVEPEDQDDHTANAPYVLS